MRVPPPPGRGRRGEEVRVPAEAATRLAVTVPLAGRDQGDHRRRRHQGIEPVQPDRAPDRHAGGVAARPNLRAAAQQRGEKHGIEGAPGEERGSGEDDLVVRRCQRQPTAHDAAVLSELEVGDPLDGFVEQCLRGVLPTPRPAPREPGGEIVPADRIAGSQHPEDGDAHPVGTGQ
jgi:hypothetical protein